MTERSGFGIFYNHGNQGSSTIFLVRLESCQQASKHLHSLINIPNSQRFATPQSIKMAFRTPFRAVALARPAAARAFHSTRRVQIRAGDELPETDGLFENSAAAKISLADEFKSGDGYIIGVPGAFTGTCSSKHIPSYINSPKLKDAGKVFVLSVNDPFVMKAWAEQLDPASQTSIRWVADPTAAFTKALDMGFDGAAAVLGGTRSQRFALKIENGKVAKVHLEADATAADVTMAEKVLQ